MTHSPRDPEATFGRDPVRRGAVLGLAAVLLVAVAGSLLAVVTGNADAVLSVLLGAVVAAVLPLGTLLVLAVTSGRSAQSLAAAVLGSYLVKLVVAAAMLFVFASLDPVDRRVMALSALVGVLLCLAGEAIGMMRTRQLYVDP